MDKPKCPRYRSLDIWRGIACLMVVIYHTTWYAADHNRAAPHDAVWWIVAATRRMWAGVPLFFVISGYCISATADSTRLHGAATTSYFWRRFRRIFPPYWIIAAVYILVLATMVYAFHFPLNQTLRDRLYAPGDLNLRHWLGNLSLTEVWSYKLMGTDRVLFLGQSWSLCYEEIFYAVMGALLAFARRRLFPALAGFSMLAAGGCALAWWRHLPAVMPHLVYWLLFASGVLVYYSVNYAARGGVALGVAGLSLGIAAAALHPRYLMEESANMPQFALASFTFALLLLAIHGADARILSWRWLRPLGHCGTLCYSLYLAHWPIVAVLSLTLYNAGVRSLLATLLLTVPICLGASLMLAQWFHATVERHFLNSPLVRDRGASLRPGDLFSAVQGETQNIGAGVLELHRG